MKIVYMGTPDFAVPCLEKIVQAGHEVALVISQPDKRMGRGKKVQMQPVKKKALELGLEVYQPERVKREEGVARIKEINPDCIVVVAYGQLLSKEILDLPPKGCVNVHGSLLPEYRGAAPIHWAIVDGKETTGITTMYMDEQLDTGDMILKAEVEIPVDATVGQMHDKLSEVGADLLVETLDQIEKGVAPREVQDDSLSTYAPLLTKATGEIDFRKPARDIYNQVRGLNPWPVAYTTYNGTRMKVFGSSVMDMSTGNKEPGTIIDVNKEGIHIATGQGVICFNEIQMPNSKRMSVDAYLRGHDIDKNITLGK